MKTTEELNNSGGVRPVLEELRVTHSFKEDMEAHWGFNWSVDSEIGKLRAVLMRRPGKEVENLGEDPLKFSMLDKLNPEGMREEFDAIKEIYERNGVKVYLLDDEDVPEDCPNIIYCRDLVNGSPNGVIINRMGINVRSKEVVAAAKKLGKIGVPIAKTITGNGTFEGACLIWLDRETVIIGRGLRSNDEGCKQVIDELKNQGVKHFIWVEIPRQCVHLDGFIAIADYDVAVVFPTLCPNNVYEELLKRGFRIVEVPTWEEKALAHNFVALEPGKIVAPMGIPVTKQRLEELGVEVIDAKVDEIRRAAGMMHCMTAPLSRDSVPLYQITD